MKEWYCKNDQVQSRWLSIGFSRHHDAAFMNSLAQTGSDLGNFIYIDTDEADYDTKVTTSLDESLAMAMESAAGLRCCVRNMPLQFDKKIVCEFNYAVDEADLSDEEGQEEKKEEVVKEDLQEMKVTLTCQAILPSIIFQEGEGILEILLMRKDEELATEFELEHLEDPPEDVKIKAMLQLSNTKIFDIIQGLAAQNMEQRE
jgi:hypothetical protein